MKMRFRLIRRGNRSWKFYCVDTVTGRRTSLQTPNEDEARQIVLAKNQALRQPALNLQIAKAYLAGSDSGVATRTWQHAMDTVVATKQDANQRRWITAIKDHALDAIRHRVLIETRAEDLIEAVRQGTVSTNVFLRKLHNFCVGMNWLPWPLVPKQQWPAVRYKAKRAITLAEHESIVAHETNPERRAFYRLAWHMGASQGDLARLNAEDIDWKDQVISYQRQKTGSVALLHFGEQAAEILRTLPQTGPLFPYLRKVRAGDRATEFKQRCTPLGIHGVSLHSYRYAWAERAKQSGYPERFAQEALGHNSKAVHRAYARKAKVHVPSLEDYERPAQAGNVLPLRPAAASEETKAPGPDAVNQAAVSAGS
jgi:integrase